MFGENGDFWPVPPSQMNAKMKIRNFIICLIVNFSKNYFITIFIKPYFKTKFPPKIEMFTVAVFLPLTKKKKKQNSLTIT